MGARMPKDLKLDDGWALLDQSVLAWVWIYASIAGRKRNPLFECRCHWG